MRKTRFERLHTTRRVALVDQIANLALAAEKKSGKPILYMTAWDIAYGFGFVAPGNGRSGEIYGYAMLYDRSVAALVEVTDNLDDADAKTVDNLRGIARDWEQMRYAHGGNTKVGKHAAMVSQVLTGAAAMIQGVTP